MNEQQNVKLVQQAYESFGRGDIQGVLNSLSEQVEWRVPKPEGVPFGGEYRGRDGVGRFFSELNQYEEVTASSHGSLLRKAIASSRSATMSPRSNRLAAQPAANGCICLRSGTARS